MKNVIEKYKGKSFAEASELIAKKYPKRDTNQLEQKAFMAEIAQLVAHQEKTRTKVQADTYPDGGMLPGMNITPARESTSVAPRRANDDLIFRKQPNVDPSLAERALFWVTGNSKQLNRMYSDLNQGINTYNTKLAQSGYEGRPKLKNGGYMNYGGLMGIPQSVFDNVKDAAKVAQKTLPALPTQGVAPARNNFLRDNIYAPVAIGKGLEFLGKAGMWASGYDRVTPELNPFEGEIRTEMQSRGISLDPLRQEVASGLNAAIDSSGVVRSQAVRQGLVQNAASNAMSAMGNIGLQQQQANNQYSAEYASVLNNLGQQEVAARNYAEQLNNQSKVGHQMSAQSLLESVGRAGQELTNFRAGIAQQQLLADTMRTANFQMGDARNLLMQAVNGKRINVDDAIQIVQNSQGKTSTQIEAEIQAAEARMNQAVTKPN